VLSLITSVYPHSARLAGLNLMAISKSHNTILIIWILIVIAPVIILTKRGHKSARIALISISVLFVGSLLYILSLLAILPQTGITKHGIQIGIIMFSGLLFYGLFDKINFIRNEKTRLATEKRKSEELLYNILPTEIAIELIETGEAKAKNFENTSVLFTDFVGFTKLSSQLTASQLLEEINYCFERFDHIIEKYDVEKIKTIGDAYMCAGGIPVENTTNPVDIVKAGLEIKEYMENLKAEREAKGEAFWELRIGIHTGSVLAGVVGKNKFAYDIWGDAVNTASRMESSGIPGKVNISGTTYSLVKDIFQCTYRGKVKAKNKGEIDMYIVEEEI